VSDEGALLAVAVEAARMAGRMLRERARHGAEEVSAKSTPTDLVSDADHASERSIRELLASRRPADGFVGEEGGSTEGASGLSWVVDPLDGTVNFLFGIPQWCVSVAVVDEQGTLAGAVYDPNREELFTARRDGRAWYAACVVLATTRADVNGLAKRHLGASKISFASMDAATEASAMEFGGITPIGLPADWPILIDEAVVAADRVVIGSGLRRSKIGLPGAALAELPNAVVLPGLGRATP